MTEPYPVIEVLPEMRGDVEQMGSKPKFWFTHRQEKWLFKEARENTGEDWSEKIASEIAEQLGLPTHHTELAIWQGVRGCAVKSFLTPKKDFLIHGNELLGGFLDNYDTEKVRGQSEHTFENIVGVIEKLFVEGTITRYIHKGRGGIFGNAEARKGLSPIALAELLSERYPELFHSWQKRVAQIEKEDLLNMFSRVPADRISPTATNFATTLLENNQQLIIDL